MLTHKSKSVSFPNLSQSMDTHYDSDNSDDEVESVTTFLVVVNETVSGTNYDGYDSDPVCETRCDGMKNVYEVTVLLPRVDIEDVTNSSRVSTVVDDIKKKIDIWGGYKMHSYDYDTKTSLVIQDAEIHNHYPRSVSQHNLEIVRITCKNEQLADGSKVIYPRDDYDAYWSVHEHHTRYRSSLTLRFR